MEPLRPETVRDLLAKPHVAPSDLEEYQRLLAERFSVDPDMPKSPHHATAIKDREDRIRELYQKLFDAPGQPVIT